MTTYLDYKTLPAENNGPPPVGAPEQMPTSQVNNVMREMMSVIRQLGDQFQAGFDDLGTMALQDADAVAITGGTVTATLAGPGGGITNLKAQNLIEGPIPASIFPPDATPLDVRVARAAQADGLSQVGITSVLPIGTIIMWYSGNPIPTGWALCDGNNGTPNLVGRFPLGAGPGVGLGQMGGAWTAAGTADAQGAHSHGGGTAGAALGVEHLPAHGHPYRRVNADINMGQANPSGAIVTVVGGSHDTVGPWGGAPSDAAGQAIGGTGGGQAHAHGIGTDGSHTHNVSVNLVPIYTAIFFIMRIA